ncbi:SDR family NAD(P)-dependent oxidoreductase [Mucilaginibacter sp. X4EP1]|uniref:SDR family NAD(P)-dependent oxidoreductase n=1 Tax=Mucilaginibacter sp. X4EP1 TaxID=2723092 RepID=UPI00216756A4|nr:SDR family NAD(P)-dependent oxidoreductase [Mucilaginibacter sp. X4EP1]MCS3816588.1 NAD(P)-dependent dehydrogenase (short-subunit alcohol dehydrogenase family) [Mucilaginibacter sp. X4EP1]
MENKKAYIITGPTSGIGYATALELAKHGTVILVGRNPDKLNQVQNVIKEKGQDAVTVVCDISDMKSVRSAAQEIIKLQLPIAGLLNNAGIMPAKAAKSAQGWDMTFATNHLGAFALTEALAPHLPDGANVVFITSAIEDPERKPAKLMGMKGGRYLSAEASAHGEWEPGGAKMPGIDAYATSKQCILAAAMAFARKDPRLHYNAVEPGITRGTGLGGESTNAFVRFLFGQLMAIIPPFSKYSSTPEKSARVIANILTDASGKTGVYFDEKGQPMFGSTLTLDPEFQDRVVAETRALLSTIK